MTYDPYRPEPGWYPAEGDPIGTHRYWDGIQWVGGPRWPDGQTVAAVRPATMAPTHGFANWGQRAAAWLIDHILFYGILIAAIVATDDGIDSTTTDAEIVGIVIAVATVIGHFLNIIVQQGITGQSIGKRVLGIRTIVNDGREPVGVLRLFGRALLSTVFLYVTCYLYFLLDNLWPAWDEKKQRITDKIFNIYVVDANPQNVG